MKTDYNETTEGRASNVTKGSHISRGQWAHQVTSATLYIFLHRSYAEYQITVPESVQLHFDASCGQMSCGYPQCYYWYSLANWSYFFNCFSDHNVNRVMLHMRSLRKIIPYNYVCS